MSKPGRGPKKASKKASSSGGGGGGGVRHSQAALDRAAPGLDAAAVDALVRQPGSYVVVRRRGRGGGTPVVLGALPPADESGLLLGPLPADVAADPAGLLGGAPGASAAQHQHHLHHDLAGSMDLGALAANAAAVGLPLELLRLPVVGMGGVDSAAADVLMGNSIEADLAQMQATGSLAVDAMGGGLDQDIAAAVAATSGAGDAANALLGDNDAAAVERAGESDADIPSAADVDDFARSEAKFDMAAFEAGGMGGDDKEAAAGGGGFGGDAALAEGLQSPLFTSDGGAAKTEALTGAADGGKLAAEGASLMDAASPMLKTEPGQQATTTAAAAPNAIAAVAGVEDVDTTGLDDLLALGAEVAGLGDDVDLDGVKADLAAVVHDDAGGTDMDLAGMSTEEMTAMMASVAGGGEDAGGGGMDDSGGGRGGMGAGGGGDVAATTAAAVDATDLDHYLGDISMDDIQVAGADMDAAMAAMVGTDDAGVLALAADDSGVGDGLLLGGERGDGGAGSEEGAPAGAAGGARVGGDGEANQGGAGAGGGDGTGMATEGDPAVGGDGMAGAHDGQQQEGQDQDQGLDTYDFFGDDTDFDQSYFEFS